MKKVICPVDFSETSINALEFAVRFCEALTMELHMVHITREDEEEATIKLEALKDEISKETSLEIHHKLITGKVANAIVKYADQEDVSYIIMGTSGARDVEEAYIGSNTVQVLEHSTKNVYCIPSKARFHGIRHIVYATNLITEDIRKIQLVCALASEMNAFVKVVHVHHKLNEKKFEKFRDELKDAVYYSRLTVESFYYDGDVEHGIDTYMNEKEADLLALSSYHRKGIEQLFHRSVTKRLSYMIDYPLIVYKI